MIPHVEQSFRPTPFLLLLLLLVVAVSLTAFMLALLLFGSTTYAIGLAGFIGLAIPTAALAWHRPVIFPLGAYAALIPFDNIALLGSSATLTRLLGALSAFAVAVAIVRRRVLLRPPRAVLVWGAAILWIIVSAFWAVDQAAAFEYVIVYLQLFGLFAIVAIFPMTRFDYLALVAAVIIGGFGAAAFGAYLFVHGQDIQNGRLVVQVSDRLIDPNHNAAALLLPFALGLVAALRERCFFKQAGLTFVVVVIAGGILLTASRGAFLGMLVVVAFLFVRSRYKLELSLSFVAVGFAAFASALRERAQTIVTSGGAGRSDIWSSAWQAFNDHWLVGVGIANFKEAYDAVYMNVYHPTYFHWHVVAHNLIAQTGVELGIVGLVLVALAWAAVLRDPPGSWRSDPFADWWRAAQAGAAGLLCASMFLDLAWYKDPWLAFMLAVAAKTRLASRNVPVVPDVRESADRRR